MTCISQSQQSLIKRRPEPVHGALALQYVERFKAGHDDRRVKALNERTVLPVAHHAADVTGGEESLYAAIR